MYCIVVICCWDCSIQTYQMKMFFSHVAIPLAIKTKTEQVSKINEQKIRLFLFIQELEFVFFQRTFEVLKPDFFGILLTYTT